MNIRYKYRNLLIEGYNFSNADDAMAAIESNQVGVKIDPSYKQLNGNTKSFTRRSLGKFFNKCEQLGIKDTTYGVQLLLSKTNDINLEQAVETDGLYEFLKSYKKPWVKELPEYQEFINSKYNKELWHNLEKSIQENQANHGKVAKGRGQIKDVKVAYDDGTWKLLIPSSFEGEKAAAFYIKDGKETPTEWCTRCEKDYYNMYTEMAPLYIIRNMKSGKSYQLAFTHRNVEFLDQNDEKGDEVTTGDLTIIPDKLLSLIKHPKNGKTLLDYKNARKEVGKAPDKKGYVKSDEAGVYPSQFKYGPVSYLGRNVCKKEVLNFTLDSIDDSLSSYFKKDGKVKVDIEYAKKHKSTAYFIKGKEDALYILQTMKNWDNDKITVDGTIFETKPFQDLSEKEKDAVREEANLDFGITKKRERDYRKRENKLGSVEKFNRKYSDTNIEWDKIVDNVNNKIKIKSLKFEKLQSFGPTPRFGFSGEWGTKALFGKTLVNTLYFMPTRIFENSLSPNMRNQPVTVMFKTPYEGDGVHFRSLKRAEYNADWTKAKTAIAITGSDWNDYFELSPEEFKLCKRIAAEIQKEIIKDPEFRKLNTRRKIEQTKQNYREGRSKTLTKQELENTVGKQKAWELTHLDQIDPNTRYPRHVMNALDKAAHRADLYEEINYFDY